MKQVILRELVLQVILVLSCFTAAQQNVLNVLPFLEPNSSWIAYNADSFSDADVGIASFWFPTPFYFNHIGYSTAQFDVNGFIVLRNNTGNIDTTVDPLSFPIPQIVIAPYWVDIDLSDVGTIYLAAFTASNGSTILDSVSGFINAEHTGNNQEFIAQSVVVLYWFDVCNFDNPTCAIADSSSFQLVLASSNETSYAIFTYNCQRLNFESPFVTIGYSANSSVYDNHCLSQADNVNDIGCLNSPYSNWTNIIFNANNGGNLTCKVGQSIPPNVQINEFKPGATILQNEATSIGVIIPSSTLLPFETLLATGATSTTSTGTAGTIFTTSTTSTGPVILNTSDGHISRVATATPIVTTAYTDPQPSCLAQCDPPETFNECCEPQNIGRFIRILDDYGIHRSYIACPANIPDWCP